MTKVRANRFAMALKRLSKPGGKHMQVLRAHYKERRLTTTALAKKVGYKGYRGINLCYGKLAARIAPLVGHPDHDPKLLLLFEADPEVIPAEGTNEHYVLTMLDEFARGLKQAGWV
jgi:hypothetical protein